MPVISPDVFTPRIANDRGDPVSADLREKVRRLERAHSAIATLALPRHGRVLQAELLGKPAPSARRKRMGLKPFAVLFRTERH